MVMEVLLHCTDLAFYIVALLSSPVHPCRGGKGEVTQTEGNLTCQTLETSLLPRPVPMPKLKQWLESSTRKVLLGLKWSHDEKLRLLDGTKGHVQAWIKGHAIARNSYRDVPVLKVAQQSMRLEKLASC